jgi:hypothetical protein
VALTRWFGPDSGLSLPARIGIGLGLLVVIVGDALLVANQFSIILAGYPGADLVVYQEAGRRIWEGGLYVNDGSYVFRYSPIAAYLFIPLGIITPLVWRGLHVIGALALPTWPMRLLLLASWPFSFDLQLGNVMTFVLLAAAWALRGNRIAAVIFLTFCLLFPRPFMVPIGAWLLWRQTALRWPFIALFAAHAALVLWTGLGGAWLTQLFASTEMVGSVFNVGPTAIVGLWWLLIGIPLGAWLFWQGRVGLAGLAISPYLLPYYLMTALLDLPSSRDSEAAAAPILAAP